MTHTYHTEDTIFALATPKAKAGVAVVRISGAQAGEALKAVLKKKSLPTPRMATLARVYHPQEGGVLDTALVLWFEAPASFTGEDTAELHLHGSRAVIAQVLEGLASFKGLRVAEPGEFSRRAFLNGKMDLTEAEGLSDLIEAETRMQMRLALRQMEGELHHLYEDWRQQLIGIMAQWEAYIDFPDEDIPPSVSGAAARAAEELTQAITRHMAQSRPAERLRDGLQVAIIGAPNAGKSSLLNALAERDVAIVSDTPGTTRDAIDIHLDMNGYPVTLTDTAGLRESEDAVEKLGIGRSRDKAAKADLILALFDGTKTPDAATLSLINEAALVVINKNDAPGVKDWKELAGHKPLVLSAQTGEGIPELLKVLGRKAEELLAIPDSPVLTKARHRALLEETLTALAGFSIRLSPELAAEHLRQAASALGRIIGIIDVEDVLDALFGSFCIGK